MSHLVKIYALFLGSALLMFSGGLQGILLAVRGADEGFSVFALGLIGTGWSVGFVAGSILVPKLVRRVGHIRSYSVMAAFGAITILLNLLWVNDIGWIFLRIFSGFCFAGAAMIVESWLNEVVDNKSRGTAFSIYVTVNLTAITIGQMSMSLTGVDTYLPFVVGAVVFMCALLPMALTTTPQPKPITTTKVDLKLLYLTSPVAVVASFSAGMANGAFGTLAPVYGVQLGLDPTAIAYLMSIAIIAGALGQVPFGKISDIIDRRIVLIIVSAAAAIVGTTLVIANPTTPQTLYIIFACYGLTAYPVYSVAVAHANDFAKDGEFARVASGMLLIFGVGLALGPAIASVMMNFIGPVGLFTITASFHGALAVTALVRMLVRPISDTEEREPFRPMQFGRATAPHTIVLDPRTETEEDTAPEDKVNVQS